jgi:hypothetical protein
MQGWFDARVMDDRTYSGWLFNLLGWFHLHGCRAGVLPGSWMTGPTQVELVVVFACLTMDPTPLHGKTKEAL